MGGYFSFFSPPSIHQRKFKWETTSSKVRHQPGGPLRRASASRRARVPLPRGLLQRAALRAAVALAAPSMLHGPSAPAAGPGALGPSMGPLTQDAPGAHLHVPPRGELDCGLFVRAPNVRAL